MRASLGMLKPGGTLVYCVCSPLPHEGVEIVDKIVSERIAKRRAIQPEQVPGFETSITAIGDLLTLPNRQFGHDAFYIAQLTRDS